MILIISIAQRYEAVICNYYITIIKNYIIHISEYKSDDGDIGKGHSRQPKAFNVVK